MFLRGAACCPWALKEMEVRDSTVFESTISGVSASGGAKLVQKGLRSLTITKIAPIHPGEVLMEDFIEGFGITQYKLAVPIGVPPRRINEIVHGKRGITVTPLCGTLLMRDTTNVSEGIDIVSLGDILGEDRAFILADLMA